ncbi:uncharacterized protein LY79DRAFT_555209, partial [Colletotrichum navitas]
MRVHCQRSPRMGRNGGLASMKSYYARSWLPEPNSWLVPSSQSSSEPQRFFLMFVPNATVPPMVIPASVELPPVDTDFEPNPVQDPLPTDYVEYYQMWSI